MAGLGEIVRHFDFRRYRLYGRQSHNTDGKNGVGRLITLGCPQKLSSAAAMAENRRKNAEKTVKWRHRFDRIKIM